MYAHFLGLLPVIAQIHITIMFFTVSARKMKDELPSVGQQISAKMPGPPPAALGG